MSLVRDQRQRRWNWQDRQIVEKQGACILWADCSNIEAIGQPRVKFRNRKVGKLQWKREAIILNEKERSVNFWIQALNLAKRQENGRNERLELQTTALNAGERGSMENLQW